MVMFYPNYLKQMIKLGENDADKHKEALIEFMKV